MTRVTLVLEPQPEGGYTVTCPYLPELVTEGDTQDDAVANAYDALHGGARTLCRGGESVDARR